MNKKEMEFRKILEVLDPEFSDFMMEQDYKLLEVDGDTKINAFDFARNYWSKPLEEVTVNANANVGNTGDKKSFCNLVAEQVTPINKLSALYLFRRYGNRIDSRGDELVKNIISGDVYYHNLSLISLPYCIGLSTFPLITDGLTFGSLTSSPPKRPNSFTNQVIRFIQIGSNHFAGATALTDYLQNYSYFTLQKPDYSDKERENDFQNLIHGISDEIRYAVQCFSGTTKIIFKNCRNETFKAELRNLLHANDITKYSILTKEGFAKILHIQRSGEDYIYKFKLGNGSILKVSSNHPCVMKQGLVSAKDVKIGDKMCVHIAEYETTTYGDYNLGRFIGLYAAEGGSGEHRINFSFHINEEEYATFVKNFVSNHFGDYIKEYLHPEEHCRRVVIYGKDISTFVKSFVQGNVWKKRLCSKCFNMSKEFRKGIIDGYFEGDGGINKSNGTKQAWSASLYLISDILDIMTSLGILTFAVRKNSKREDISLSCKGDRNTKKCGTITWLKRSNHSRTIQQYFSDKIDENTYWVPVVDIEISTVKHPVYDITIDKEDQLFKLANGIIVHNSPFVNISISSPETMRYSMANYLWGETKISDLMDEIMKNQLLYAKFIAKGQLNGGVPVGLPYRFPITTLVADPSFSKEYEPIWEEILKGNANLCHLNIFNNMKANLKSLSMCCRLAMDLSLMDTNINNTFGSFLQIGSHGVCTINMPRIAYETKDETKFIEILLKKMKIAHDLLKIHREEILQKRRLKYHYFFSRGYLNLNRHFFSTIGFVGLANALEILGMKVTEPSGLKFALKILKTMKDETVKYAEKDNYLYNIEEVPAETAAGTLAQKDKLLFNGSYEYYDSQFVPLSYDINLVKRIEIEGELQEHCTGGSISHLNLDGRPEPEALYSFTNNILQNSKLRQFAFNAGFTICKSGHNNMGIHKKCRTCGSEDVDWITRIVGYFTPTNSWNRAKQLEFKTRKWNKLE